MTFRLVSVSGTGALRPLQQRQGSLLREIDHGTNVIRPSLNMATFRNAKICRRHASFLASSSQLPSQQHRPSWATDHSRRPKHNLLVCNHNLNGLRSSQLHNLTSCGRCNLLGNYDINHDRLHLSKYTSLLSTNASDTNWIVLRSLHVTPRAFKEESKAEQTIKVLKDEAKIKSSLEDPPLIKDETTKTSKVTAAAAAAPKEEAKTAVATPAKKSLKERIVAEVKHYYHGFRLLFIDVRICMRMLWQVLNGKSLNRRERRQLVRTTADLFRLLPFSVFIIVPFMEFLLPVALKLFPGMLPSTFAEESKEQDKLKKRLKVKLEMAKFLQDTIEETALTRKGAKGENVQEFVNFMEKIRSSGAEVSNTDILKYSKLFDEDMTLDNLSYPQLRALLGLLDLPAVGTSNFLRFKLRIKLRQLKTDDRMIQKEGLDAMTVWELQEACRARGMRALGVPKERLQSQLDQWLDLHLNENIPTSLLLMSRTLYLPEELSKEEQLKATISALPDTTAEEAKLKISEVTGERVDHKTKVELIKQEEEAIKKDAEEIEAKKAEEEAKKAEEEAKKAEKEILVDTAEPLSDSAEVLRDAARPIAPSVVDSAPGAGAPSSQADVLAGAVAAEWAEVRDAGLSEEISPTELEEMEDVLERVAEEKDVSLDQEELAALKEDVSEYKEAIEDLREVALSSLGASEQLEESKSAKRLSKKVNKMVSQMDNIMSGLKKEKEQIQENIEIAEVRIKRAESGLREDIIEQISQEKRNLVGMNDLLLAMRRIQKVPDDTKNQRILQVLDEDCDGVIDITDAVKVIELLGRENVSLQAEQMTEIISLLQKEAEIEQRDKEERQREKLERRGAEGETAATDGEGSQQQKQS